MTHEARKHRTRLVLLGTAGGPVWWPNTKRFGIAQALVVADSVYLIDAGEGALHQYRQAGLPENNTVDREAITNLKAAFFTHLHSDHIVDYNNLLQWGITNGGQIPSVPPVKIFGPGNRGQLPPLFGSAPAPPVVNPENPTPGTVEMTEYLIKAYATDFNDRARDNRLPDPRTDYEIHDIELPSGLAIDPNVDPAPPLDPFLVYEDDRVRVTATLVYHAPVFPAFAFRFDTDDGSVVFSGDTNANANLIKLATNADFLVHEVIDPNWTESLFPDPTTPEAQGLIAHLNEAHTLIEEVGGVAEAANAETLVLTHLVPPYTPRRRWLDAGKGYSGRLIVGEDLLQIGVGRRRTRRRRKTRRRMLSTPANLSS